jgi:hypothetical protein
MLTSSLFRTNCAEADTGTAAKTIMAKAEYKLCLIDNFRLLTLNALDNGTDGRMFQ